MKMRFNVFLKRISRHVDRQGCFEAYVVEGYKWGGNLLAGRMISDIETAKKAAESTLIYDNPMLTEAEITWQGETE